MKELIFEYMRLFIYSHSKRNCKALQIEDLIEYINPQTEELKQFIRNNAIELENKFNNIIKDRK